MKTRQKSPEIYDCNRMFVIALIQSKEHLKIISRLINSSFSPPQASEILNKVNDFGLYQMDELSLAHGLHHQWHTAGWNRSE
jgi:hypothetical protein